MLFPITLTVFWNKSFSLSLGMWICTHAEYWTPMSKIVEGDWCPFQAQSHSYKAEKWKDVFLAFCGVACVASVSVGFPPRLEAFFAFWRRENCSERNTDGRSFPSPFSHLLALAPIFVRSQAICGVFPLKEARNSFFGLGVYLLKSKFRIEDKLRFPWYYITFSTYDQSLFSHWFPSNSCHHSNGNSQPLILNNVEYLEN